MLTPDKFQLELRADSYMNAQGFCGLRLFHMPTALWAQCTNHKDLPTCRRHLVEELYDQVVKKNKKETTERAH